MVKKKGIIFSFKWQRKRDAFSYQLVQPGLGLADLRPELARWFSLCCRVAVGEHYLLCVEAEGLHRLAVPDDDEDDDDDDDDEGVEERDHERRERGEGKQRTRERERDIERESFSEMSVLFVCLQG